MPRSMVTVETTPVLNRWADETALSTRRSPLGMQVVTVDHGLCSEYRAAEF